VERSLCGYFFLEMFFDKASRKFPGELQTADHIDEELLRYAPVEMTKGELVVARGKGSGKHRDYSGNGSSKAAAALFRGP
jgi:hypothetical protein